MQHIANQLNKVKNISEKESKSKNHDMAADSTNDLIKCILSDSGGVEGKTVAVFNTKSGILPIGLSFLSPLLILSITNEYPDDLFRSNLRQFGVSCDVIVTSTPPFSQGILDIGIVGPTLEKSKSTDLSSAMSALEMCRSVYVVFRSEHRRLMLDKFRETSVIGSLLMKLPGSSSYHRQNSDAAQFDILKIKCTR